MNLTVRKILASLYLAGIFAAVLALLAYFGVLEAVLTIIGVLVGAILGILLVALLMVAAHYSYGVLFHGETESFRQFLSSHF